MRDLVLREALRTMAGDAALRLRELIAAGAEVPYEVRESGESSPLAQYVPQTSRFIRDRAGELAGLDSFGSACAALEAADLAGPYLAEMGVPEPQDPRRRAELAGIVFLCRLWQGSTDFTLEDARLEDTMDELLALADPDLDEVEIAVPLRGLRMDCERLELPGAVLVRADGVDVPADARAPEGMGRAAWEPIFLAVARLELPGEGESDEELGVRAQAAFRRLVTTLRLFKAGGIALGPYAWIRAGGDRWRRIATGAGKPRPGGYSLAHTELADLAGFARALADPATPFARGAEPGRGFPAALARAISRFEAGLERPLVVEALNDYLLTLRFLLEGGGPAGLGMPMRVAALCAEPDGRTEVKATIERALTLERELWSGEPASPGPGSPADVAAELEELVRAILKDAACGHLGNDLRTTADEVLLGDGLAVGEGSAAQRGGTAEWESEPELELELVEPEAALNPAAAEPGEPPFEPDVPFDETPADEGWLVDELPAEAPTLTEPEIREPLPGDPRERFRVTRAENKLHELRDRDGHLDFEWEEEPAPAPRAAEPGPQAYEDEPPPAEAAGHQEPAEAHVPGGRHLHAVPERGPVAALIADSDEHRRDVAERVSFLFPRPETTEWRVPEVGYDRRRRAQPEPDAS